MFHPWAKQFFSNWIQEEWNKEKVVYLVIDRSQSTLLGRLAVDHRQTSKRYGELMLLDALHRALDASRQVASLAVIAEAKDEVALNFYKMNISNNQNLHSYLS